MKRCLLFVLLLLAACGTNPHGCVDPYLTPRYLPPGLQRTNAHPLVPGSRAQTWQDAARTVQIVAGVDANLGEAKQTKVRGRSAVYGSTGLPDAPLAVEWSEGPCAAAQYAIVVKGISTSEMLKIAGSLRPA